METSIGIKEMLNVAIKMEDEGVEFYKTLADKAGNHEDYMFYKPINNKVAWNKDKGFYEVLEKKVLGANASNFYHQSMAQEVSHDDSLSFYKSVGKQVNEDVKSVLLSMADDETRHGKTFRKWLAEIDESKNDNNAFNEGAAEFFQKHSKNMTFDTTKAAPTGIAEALSDAIDTEDGAVDFYKGMLEFAKPEAAKLLSLIVKEEEGHKTKLQAQKDKFDLLMKSL